MRGVFILATSATMLVAHASAFSQSITFVLPLKPASACKIQGAVRPRHFVQGVIKLKAQAVPGSDGRYGLTDGQDSTAANSFTRKDGSLMTKLEKEQLYLDCCASWNIDKKPLMEDTQFEALKEDLTFDGSMVMMMSRQEIQFMVAKNRYCHAMPIDLGLSLSHACAHYLLTNPDITKGTHS